MAIVLLPRNIRVSILARCRSHRYCHHPNPLGQGLHHCHYLRRKTSVASDLGSNFHGPKLVGTIHHHPHLHHYRHHRCLHNSDRRKSWSLIARRHYLNRHWCRPRNNPRFRYYHHRRHTSHILNHNRHQDLSNCL